MNDRPTQWLTATTSLSSLRRRLSSHRKKSSGEGEYYNNIAVSGGGVEPRLLRQHTRPRALSLNDVFDGADEHDHLLRKSPGPTSPLFSYFITRTTTSTPRRSREFHFPVANRHGKREPADSRHPTSSPRDGNSSSILGDKPIDVVVGCCESMGLDREVGGLLEGGLEKAGRVDAALPQTEHDVGIEAEETNGTRQTVATFQPQRVVSPELPNRCSPHEPLSSSLVVSRYSSIATEAHVVLGGHINGLERVHDNVVVTEAWSQSGEGENEETATSVPITCIGNNAAVGFPRFSPQHHDSLELHPDNTAAKDAAAIERGRHWSEKDTTAAGLEVARYGADNQKALATQVRVNKRLCPETAMGHRSVDIDDAATTPRATQCREYDNTGCSSDIEDRSGQRQVLLTATISSSPPAAPSRLHYSGPRCVLKTTGSADNEMGTDNGRNAVSRQGLHRRERIVTADNHDIFWVPENRQLIMNAIGGETQREGSRRRVFMRNAGVLSPSEHGIDRREYEGFESPHAPEDLPVTLFTTACGSGVKHPGSAVRHAPCDEVHPTTTYEYVASNDDNSGDATLGSPDGLSITPGSSCSTCKSSLNSVAEVDTDASSPEHIQEHDTLAISALNTAYNKNSERLFVSPIHDDRAQYSENYGTMDFLARQELEQLAAEHKREDRQRAEEERQRDLACSGQWMNRTSRKMLARRGRVGKPQVRKANSGSRQSVFERLASRTHIEETISAAETGTPESGYPHEDLISRSLLGGYIQQPFQPTISRRSNLLASRMTDRNDEGRLCERLHKEWDGERRKRERRVERADQASRDKAAASYVRPVSERILARRFRSTMIKALSVVDDERRGWLPISDLEYVLRECGILHSEDHQKQNEDVLLAVWGALSEEIGSGGISSREGANHNGTACGVPVGRLSAVLTAVASGRYRHDARKNEPTYPGKHSACKNGLSSPVFSCERQGWREGEQGWGQAQRRAPVVDGELVDVRKGDVIELCKYLRVRFEANRRSRRAGKNKRWSERRLGGSSTNDVMSRMEAEGIDDTKRCVPSGRMASATPAQVAATALRFEEKARARERKIELLRQAGKARENTLHTFEPCLAATLEGLSLRHKAATLARRPDTSIGGERSSEEAVPCRHHAKSYQQDEADQQRHRRTVSSHRTSEDREVEDKCTFRPHLFQLQAPRPLPRHPTEDAVNGEVVSTRTSARHRTTSCWNSQVERLKTGRTKRLRRLETENSTALRSDPLPPSIQELFINAGLRPRDHSRISKHDAQEGAEKRSRLPASPPRLYLEWRMYARRKWEQQRSQEQARKQAEKDAQQEKRKRALARASRRATANVGLEAALSAREAKASHWDPPMLIAEVEFVTQARWVLLPLWMDTCASGAVGELTKQEHMPDAIATELELILGNEMERARLRLGSDQARERNKGKKGARGYRQAIPTVLLSVDTAGSPRLPGSRTADGTFPTD